MFDICDGAWYLLGMFLVADLAMFAFFIASNFDS